MKIREVICEVYRWELARPKYSGTAHPYPVGEVPLHIIRIVADDGTEGMFFRTDVGFSESEINLVRQVLIDRDPFDREWIWQRLWRLSRLRRDGFMKVLTAVDIALWDLAGKALGVPVYKLMGAYRDKIKIYASSHSMPTVQEYLDDIDSCKERGVTAYKIHPGSRDGQECIELCRAVRARAGDKMKLMFDNAGMFESREEAFRVGRELEQLNYYWYEEPLRDYDIEGLIMLREKLDIPICATENVLSGMFDVPEFILRRAVDIVRSDTRLFGGITPCKRVADLCNVFGMQCEIHAATPLCDLANLHVECAIGNCEFHEQFWPPSTPAIPLREFPQLDDEGFIHVPQVPGLGIEIDWLALGEPVGTV